MELFFPKISLDLTDGLQFFHNNGIAYWDLKPANVLVSNEHYAIITDAAELNMAIKNNPIQCKLTDFGESRSLIHQTRTVLVTRTKHMQRGTLLFMVPEQLPGKCQIKQAKQENLMKVDIWQLGMTLFCLINPGLNAPFDIEFDRMTDIPEFPEELIANYLNAGNLPTTLDRYHIQRQIYWNRIYYAHRMCSQVNPGEQQSLDDVRNCIEKKEKKSNKLSRWH